jgi:hypothetical protein
VSQGRLSAIEASPPTASEVTFARVLGSVGLILGILTILAIIYSALV